MSSHCSERRANRSLQWPGTVLNGELNDTKKVGEIGDEARRAGKCLGNILARLSMSWSARHLLSSKSLSSQSSNHDCQWSITSSNFL